METEGRKEMVEVGSNRMRVRAWYGGFLNEGMDSAIFKAAGRASDFSGAGSWGRDHGWDDLSEIEAHRMVKAIQAIGVNAKIGDFG